MTAFLYNGLMWAATVLVFHGMHPQLAGGWLTKSLKSYRLTCLFFLSVSAGLILQNGNNRRGVYDHSIQPGSPASS